MRLMKASFYRKMMQIWGAGARTEGQPRRRQAMSVTPSQAMPLPACLGHSLTLLPVKVAKFLHSPHCSDRYAMLRIDVGEVSWQRAITGPSPGSPRI